MGQRKRETALLLAGFLLLAACTAPAARPSALKPTPTPEVTVTPTPEPTPTPTSEPTSTPEEIKELWGFPIDDTHDAFEVPTGGKLGTVLVTVEENDEKYDFSVWAAGDLENPIQSASADFMGGFHGYELMDVNFDGYMDFCYTYGLGNANAIYNLWVWSEEKGQFIISEMTFGMGFTLDEATQTISHWQHGSASSGVWEYYRWENDELVCSRRIELHYPEYNEDGTYNQLATVEDWVNGEMTEVFREYCTNEEPGDTYPFEKVWKWQDLSYHGENVETLWGFPIDDTHDAFEVPTGGKLGTVLVTVEIEESNDLDWDYHLAISVWKADDLETPIQSFEAGSDSLGGYHGHNDNVRDANFDGYMDFGWRCFWGNQPIYYHYWIWDEEQGLFVEEPEFDKISCPRFDEETGVIDGYARGGFAGAAGTTTFHRWIDGKLVCVRKIITFPYGSDTLNEMRLTIEETVNGELIEVFRLESDIGTVFQEAEKWKDLDYHGEP